VKTITVELREDEFRALRQWAPEMRLPWRESLALQRARARIVWAVERTAHESGDPS
jgi:hypothetical protein